MSLLIIDTLSAYMGAARDMHRQNEVGEFLAELTEIAESAGCGVLAIAHLNKQIRGASVVSSRGLNRIRR